jgi:hypothetical protein
LRNTYIILGLCQRVYTVGYMVSPTLTHNIRCSSPSRLPTYTVPETCFRSGPDVVVNRADRALSGSNDRRSDVRPAVDDAEFSSDVGTSSFGTSMPKLDMIWSAVRRRSDDLRGASGLICRKSYYCQLQMRYWIQSPKKAPVE